MLRILIGWQRFWSRLVTQKKTSLDVSRMLSYVSIVDGWLIISLRQNIEKAKKNQMRRAARKKTMKGELEVYEGDETGVSVNLCAWIPNLWQKRKCGACGMIGHTKANRMCPKFQTSVGPSPAGGTPTAPTPGGGYGMPFTPIDVPESVPTTSLKIRLGGVRPQ